MVVGDWTAMLADSYVLLNLNKAVKRNAETLSDPTLCFSLISRSCKFEIPIWNIKLGRAAAAPIRFTEQGVAMLLSVLNSERAVKVNIAIMRAFVKLRETLDTNRELAGKFSVETAYSGAR